MIFLHVAMTIVLVHSFVPHQHHEELSIEEHNRQHREASGWIDYLLLAFHIGPNQGHLDEFHSTETNVDKSNDSDQFEFDVQYYVESIFIASELISTPIPKIHTAFTGDFLSNTRILRGPPTNHIG